VLVELSHNAQSEDYFIAVSHDDAAAQASAAFPGAAVLTTLDMRGRLDALEAAAAAPTDTASADEAGGPTPDTADVDPEMRDSYVAAAKRMFTEPGEIEIDEDAKLSDAGGGAWVQAWVRVPDEELHVSEPVASAPAPG
jgi:hypothetical protein